MIDRAELKSMAKEQIRGNIGMLFLCFFVYSLIVGASATVMIGPLLISPPLYFGLLMIFLGLTRGEKPQLEKMFEGFQMFGKSIGVWFLMNLFITLWSLLFFIPGIIKSIAYMFAPYISVENPEMSVTEAIQASKDMTNGHKMELFVLGLSFIPWILLGTITLGIAYIYVMPYYQTTITNAYNKLKNKGEELPEA